MDLSLYFDTNIFADIENNKYTVEDLSLLVPEGNKLIFFSGNHISEAENTKFNKTQSRNDLIFKRYQTMLHICKNNYLYFNIEDDYVFNSKLTPFEVSEWMSETHSLNFGINSLLNIVTEKQKTEFRNFIGFETKKINNYSTIEIIDQLNKSVPIGQQSVKLLDFPELILKNKNDKPNYSFYLKFGILFELLDLIGYWKDESTPDSNVARQYDSGHAYFASFCDFFFTNDKRTTKKAEVLYSIYNIPTKVISPLKSLSNFL